MEFQDVLNSRYSCRAYDSRQVEPEKLHRVLEAGRICPTARNCQPQRVYVLQSPEARAKAAELSPCTYDAPTILMICSDTEQACPSRGDWKDYNQIDPTIAASFMMLEAANLGLANCYVCMFDADEMAEAFDLPQTIKPLCLLLLGYAAADAKPSPMHADRNDMDTFVAATL